MGYIFLSLIFLIISRICVGIGLSIFKKDASLKLKYILTALLWVLILIIFYASPINEHNEIKDINQATILAEKISEIENLREISFNDHDSTFGINYNYFTYDISKVDTFSYRKTFYYKDCKELDQIGDSIYFNIFSQLDSFDLERFYKKDKLIIFVQGGWIDSEYGVIYTSDSTRKPIKGEYINGNGIKDLEVINKKWYSFYAD